MSWIHSPIVLLRQLDSRSAGQYGPKACNLGALTKCDVEVPFGIALGKDALAYFLQANGINLAELTRLHTLGMTFLESSITEVRDLQKHILEVIHQAPFPALLIDEVFGKIDAALIDERFAIRSSCVVEDSASSSFAGQYVTVLDVSGKENLVDAIRACWASQYDGRGLTYAISKRGMPILQPSMGVLIQIMVRADYAGVCFTEGPTSKTRDCIIVESVEGLGEALVSGTQTPSHFEIDKTGSFLKSIRVPGASKREISAQQVSLIIVEATKIADYFGCPQDIEWALIGDKVYILQARPITTLGSRRGAIGFGTASTKSGEAPVALNREDTLTELRDDLHEWLVTHNDLVVFRGASFILATQHSDGAWRIDGHPEWTHVSTALAVRLLLDGGLSAAARWPIIQPNRSYNMLGVSSAVNWLADNIDEGGTWGSDLWDTCQVLLALLKFGIRPDEARFARALRFVIEEITKDLHQSRTQEWFGAGFLSAALSLFEELRNQELSKTCLRLLLESQATTGEFSGPSAHRTTPQVPSEWHTAQAISALASPNADGARMRAAMAACEWLSGRQHPGGSWGAVDSPYSQYNSFFTAFAVMALSDAKFHDTAAIARGTKWMRGQQVATGGFGDIGASLMVMAAMQKVSGPAFILSLPLPTFMRIQTTLSAELSNTFRKPPGE
ncbi:PEP/pyruvate-binding domain-containing protein [Rhodoferax sp.]|uniref:PEP/pyruvate-binding domain-containing protein n=1 Tax=Rhodoferax sp. TaxID=50421 RepID=UPI002768E87A|nr:PEP/pyruvate-binding domain-containing protein [Rhodoferax sp.]